MANTTIINLLVSIKNVFYWDSVQKAEPIEKKECEKKSSEADVQDMKNSLDSATLTEMQNVGQDMTDMEEPAQSELDNVPDEMKSVDSKTTTEVDVIEDV